MNMTKGLFRPLHAAGLLALSALALTLSTALPTQATGPGTRQLSGDAGRKDTTAEAVSVSRVYCPRGTAVQSGGYSTTHWDQARDGTLRHTVLASHPVVDASGRKGWYASAAHAEVTAHVVCAPSPDKD
ncbi:hypothetical protein OTB20_25890 [Streptomyces sp. H27-H1]|uniref:hypothetical protein n=1 Tax=Streptomyces sp. H27-H1 TaxID=2996461 RepID=UPI002271617E|nr:hypothetical protein [Streptomyces sp. H27-H1]MCY0929567.1 hypothetical protein [Streptomyces sp. H27-H1]